MQVEHRDWEYILLDNDVFTPSYINCAHLKVILQLANKYML
jgi:hypothetical protein